MNLPLDRCGLRSRRAHHLLIWLVMVALGVYASSASMLRMLGATHWHAPVMAGTAALSEAGRQPPGHEAAALRQLGHWLADIRHLADGLHARAHALGLEPHTHSHSSLLRHWHGEEDQTVRVADGADLAPELADLSAAAAIGSATLLLALGPDGLWQIAAQANGAWPDAARPSWRSHRLPPPSEPPIA